VRVGSTLGTERTVGASAATSHNYTAFPRSLIILLLSPYPYSHDYRLTIIVRPLNLRRKTSGTRRLRTSRRRFRPQSAPHSTPLSPTPFFVNTIYICLSGPAKGCERSEQPPSAQGASSTTSQSLRRRIPYGRRYYVTFANDHTRYTKLEALRTKDEALRAYSFSWAQTQLMPRASSDSVLIAAVSSQVINLPLMSSSKAQSVA
jgi:hypothetical protein